MEWSHIGKMIAYYFAFIVGWKSRLRIFMWEAEADYSLQCILLPGVSLVYALLAKVHARNHTILTSTQGFSKQSVLMWQDVLKYKKIFSYSQNQRKDCFLNHLWFLQLSSTVAQSVLNSFSSAWSILAKHFSKQEAWSQ